MRPIPRPRRRTTTRDARARSERLLRAWPLLTAVFAAGAIGPAGWATQAQEEPVAPAKKDRYLIKSTVAAAAKPAASKARARKK